MGEAQRVSTERVGVIGLAIIGSVWVEHYLSAGVLAGTWNRSAKPGAPAPAVDHIDPYGAGRFAERVRARGAGYLEAPFMGSRPAAEQRKVAFLTGGEPAMVERAHAVLGLLSGSVLHIGDVPGAAESSSEPSRRGLSKLSPRTTRCQ